MLGLFGKGLTYGSTDAGPAHGCDERTSLDRPMQEPCGRAERMARPPPDTDRHAKPFQAHTHRKEV